MILGNLDFSEAASAAIVALLLVGSQRCLLVTLGAFGEMSTINERLDYERELKCLRCFSSFHWLHLLLRSIACVIYIRCLVTLRVFNTSPSL